MNAQIDDRSVIGIDLHQRRSVVVRLVADGQQTDRATRFTDDVPHPPGRAGSPGRPASRQMAFLLVGCAGSASVVAALLGIRVRTVHRHCRGRPPLSGSCAAVSWTSCAGGVCPIVRWKRHARREGMPGARPAEFRVS